MMRLNVNLTIRRMLTGLVCISVVIIVTMAITTFHSNYTLLDSQKQLTEIILPLDTVTQGVMTSALNFAVRRHAIRDAGTLEKLGQLADRKQLEQTFTTEIRRLRELSRKEGVRNVGRSEELKKIPDLIRQVENVYREMLDRDDIILKSMGDHLRLEKEIGQQIVLLDQGVAELARDTEIFSERIGAVIRATEGGSLSEASALALKNTGELRLSAVLLGNHTYQMALTGEDEKISSLISDKIEAAAGRIASLLNALSKFSPSVPDMGTDGKKDAGLPDMIIKIGTDSGRIRTAAAGEGNSLAMLRHRWLAEQKNMHSHDAALSKALDSVKTRLEEIHDIAGKMRVLAEQEASEVSSTSGGIIIAVLVIAIPFIIMAGKLITRRIILPISKAVDFAETIAGGDLTAEIRREHNDEVGNMVSKMGEMSRNLNTLIGQVQRSGIQVTSSATELSATSRQQEAVMKTQLESTNYVLRSVGEISSISEELVDTMRTVASMSDQTAEFASSGQADLAHMEEAMHHMENASKSISGKLETINEKAANITSVVTTITKVADQTNLLSLNAAIEAEKAGEYGRGFTVVAREIRRLADQTAVATLDIDQMVQEMQSAVSAGVMEMDAFIAEVQRSAENVGKISMQLSRIIEQVQGLSPSFEGVNESMQLQFANAREINSSMVNLSEEMQQTVESLRESFLAIEQLNDAARGLQEEVSRFKVIF